MSFNLNISGELSKREVGLISIIFITTIGAIFTFEKDYLISLIFILLTFGSVLVYLLNFISNSFKSDWIEEKLPILLLLDELYSSKSALSKNREFLITIYEQFYFRAIKEKNIELADAFENKIAELKNIKVEK